MCDGVKIWKWVPLHINREMFGYYEIESRLLYFGLRSEAAEILNSQ